MIIDRPSQRQLEVFSHWQNNDSNLLINAVAGSGKTTTLLQLLEYCEEKTLFLAFNKSVKDEIQGRIDNTPSLEMGKALTMHSLGLSAIREGYSSFYINNGKNYDIVKNMQDKYKRQLKTISWQDRIRLNYTLMDMNDISRIFLTDDITEIATHFLSMDKSFYNLDILLEIWEDLIDYRENLYSSNKVEIDFVDMIYLPVSRDLTIPIDPTYLMIDECQDLNLCQHNLVDKLINQGVKKWIAVGDRNQAIYGFSGAYSTSFDLFLERGNVVELPLDICYRCPTKIIDAANEVYPVIQYSSNVQGIVETVSDPKEVKDNSMIICRNSGPLISLYFQMLGLDKACYIKGEDILNSVLRFLKPYKQYSVANAAIEMSYKIEEMTYNNSENERISLYVFKENFENFKKLSANLCEGFESIDFLINKVKACFVDKQDATMLCTIHKSKGLESDIVYILNENLIPSKYAKSVEQLKQENNLKYVARTRAKKELYYLNI